jgi:hypothetical protein
MEKERKKMTNKREPNIDFLLVAFVWGILLFVSLLNVGKDLVIGERPEMMVFLIVALVTVLGSLLGSKTRMVTGAIWGVVAIAAFLTILVIAGLEVEEVFGQGPVDLLWIFMGGGMTAGCLLRSEMGVE